MTSGLDNAHNGSEKPVAAERPAKLPRVGKGCAKGSAKGKGKSLTLTETNGHVYMGGVWNGYCFTDIVWTPEMQQRRDSEKQKVSQLVRALYRAMDMHSGRSVTLSQLGSDFKVAELKKDPYFKNWRLLDILREYEDVFELVPNAGVTGGMMVSLQPGAEAALPDAEDAAEVVDEAELQLPERIGDPRGIREKIQALRIELLHALHRRGGKTLIQELGQEPRVQKVKQGLHQTRKLVDWVKIFPDNFRVSSHDGAQMMVEMESPDVDDQSMIDKILRTSEQEKLPQHSRSRGGTSGGREGRGHSGGGQYHSHYSLGGAQAPRAHETYPGVTGYSPHGYPASLGYGPPPPAMPAAAPHCGYGYAPPPPPHGYAPAAVHAGYALPPPQMQPQPAPPAAPEKHGAPPPPPHWQHHCQHPPQPMPGYPQQPPPGYHHPPPVYPPAGYPPPGYGYAPPPRPA